MKGQVSNFLKPRLWTVFLSLTLVAWQYVYAFRGIDFEALGKIRTYFGFGLAAINWNNFLVRTLSMGLIWILVAFVIFLLLWLTESYIVGSHNRRIAREYVNRPKEDFAHLLRSRNRNLGNTMGSVLWFSSFLVLIPIGLFMVAGLLEMIRSNLVISYVASAQEAGTEIDFFNVNLLVISFLATLPFWYLYSCLDTFCFLKSKREEGVLKIEIDHYAVPVVDPENFAKPEVDQENDSTVPPSPVI